MAPGEQSLQGFQVMMERSVLPQLNVYAAGARLSLSSPRLLRQAERALSNPSPLNRVVPGDILSRVAKIASYRGRRKWVGDHEIGSKRVCGEGSTVPARMALDELRPSEYGVAVVQYVEGRLVGARAFQSVRLGIVGSMEARARTR